MMAFCALFYKQKYCEILLRSAGFIVITIVTVCRLSMHLKIMLMLYIAAREAWYFEFYAHVPLYLAHSKSSVFYSMFQTIFFVAGECLPHPLAFGPFR